MYKVIFKRFCILCVMIILLPAITFSEKPKKEREPQTPPPVETTQLRVEVKGGEDAAAVRGATVYIEWTENGQSKNKEGTTNRKGIVGPYAIPKVKVFIQVTSNDGKWEYSGGNYDLSESEQTITINLTARERTEREE